MRSMIIVLATILCTPALGWAAKPVAIKAVTKKIPEGGLQGRQHGWAVRHQAPAAQAAIAAPRTYREWQATRAQIVKSSKSWSEVQRKIVKLPYGCGGICTTLKLQEARGAWQAKTHK